MTEDRAETIATVLIGAAVAGAAFYILKTPALRRLAWQSIRTLVFTNGPVWLAAEAKRAWNDSARPAGREQGDMIAG
jgi:hypothetical protein